MEIQLSKAKRVLKNYRESNFNAKKALLDSGYSEQTAMKGSKRVINNAIKKVAKEEYNEIVSSSNPMNKLLQTVGISEGELINEYMYIVKQNKDLTNKLKALTPLLKTVGVEWNEQATTVNPTLNLTVEQVAPIDGSVKPLIDTNSVVVNSELGVGGRADVDSVPSFPLSPISKSTEITLSTENNDNVIPTVDSSHIGVDDISGAENLNSANLEVSPGNI